MQPRVFVWTHHSFISKGQQLQKITNLKEDITRGPCRWSRPGGGRWCGRPAASNRGLLAGDNKGEITTQEAPGHIQDTGRVPCPVPRGVKGQFRAVIAECYTCSTLHVSHVCDGSAAWRKGQLTSAM